MSDEPSRPPREPITPSPPADLAPVTVRNACWLILFALGLGFVTLLPGLRPPQPDVSAGGFVFEALWIAVFSGLTYRLTKLIRRRRNWARWTMLGLLAVGWVLVVATLSDELARSPVTVAIETITTIVEMFAAWLLFTGSGARWFAGPTE